MSEPDPLRDLLRERFGHDDFRGPQRSVVEAVVAGRDALLTMPTGGGKSLCYQLPALAVDGLTLVVSPLIALMKDQVDALRARGIAATFVNSSISGAERRARLEAARRGELDLLYVTPERFRSETFARLLPRLPITRLAIDEAHCISQWGHDFRPDYSRLGEYRAQLGDPPTIALTATATPRVARDIAEVLRLDEPLVVRTGIERPNLFLAVSQVFDADEKNERIAERLLALDGPGIVYSALIRDLEALHVELARRGIESLVYHGDLSAEERRDMQERFMRSRDAVVLATNAFGMGVDKADIRFVLHAQIPRTLEAWSQEVGRAGRDGAPSWCELFYLEQDLAIQQNFIQWANPTLEYIMQVHEVLRGWGERLQLKDLDDLRQELLVKERRDNRVSIALKWLEVLGATRGSFETRDLEVSGELDPACLPAFLGTGEKLEDDLRGLLAMVQFAKEDERCRRVRLAEHFELETAEEGCSACDNCVPAGEWRSEHFRPRARRAGPAREGGPRPRAEARAETGERGAPGHGRRRGVRADGGGADARGGRGAGSTDRERGVDREWSVERERRADRGGGAVRDGGSGEDAARANERGRDARSDDVERARFRRGDWVRVDRRHIGQVVRVDGRGSRQQLIVESASDLRRRRVDPRRQRVERLDSDAPDV